MSDMDNVRSELQKLSPWLYKDPNTTRATGVTPTLHCTKRDDMLQRDYNLLYRVCRTIDTIHNVASSKGQLTV